MATVVCQNIFHRSTTVEVDGDEVEVEFEKDSERGVAVAEVPGAVADALTDEEGYKLGDSSQNDGVDAESTSVIDGIGPTYEEKLAEAGIETVADLAEADAEEVAEQGDLDAEDVAKWIDYAQAHQ